MLLNQFGLVDLTKDSDILSNPKDTENVKLAINTIGTLLEVVNNSDKFKSDDFFRYDVDGTEVEFMVGFRIKCEDSLYEVIFDEESIVSTVLKDEVKINLMSLEDWFVIYHVLGDPKNRTHLISKYFEKNGVIHKNILIRNLNLQMTEYIKNEILNLISY
ncbi:hypothetical protein [Paraclostridium bifermentans]|uniref:hypothetical protein n=1 Tax=Paraclostridium bifermentans TaxID=1490 RepID=UPI001C82013C|nr:hypothetical protein [Paraclostridium bifermentans]